MKTFITYYHKSRESAKTGAHKLYFRLLDKLSSSHRIILISPSNPYSGRETIDHYRIQPTKFRSNLLPNSFVTGFSIIKQIRSLLPKIEKESIFAAYSFGMSNVYPLLYLQKKLDISCFLSLHSDPFKYIFFKLEESGMKILPRVEVNVKLLNKIYYEIFKKINCFSLGRIDNLFVLSDFHREALAKKCKGLHRGNIHVQPNNIPKRSLNFPFSNRMELDSEEFKLVFVGSLIPRKGVKFLIQAVAKLSDKFNYRLKIIGDGESRERLERLVREKELQDCIAFMGYVDNPIPHIAKSDCLVLPSIAEAFPLTILEAMGVNTPVIGTKTGAVPDIIGEEKYLVKAKSPGELKGKIENLLKPSNYKEAKEYFNERKEEFIFDWEETFVSTIFDIIE